MQFKFTTKNSNTNTFQDADIVNLKNIKGKLENKPSLILANLKWNKNKWLSISNKLLQIRVSFSKVEQLNYVF